MDRHPSRVAHLRYRYNRTRRTGDHIEGIAQLRSFGHATGRSNVHNPDSARGVGTDRVLVRKLDREMSLEPLRTDGKGDRATEFPERRARLHMGSRGNRRLRLQPTPLQSWLDDIAKGVRLRRAFHVARGGLIAGTFRTICAPLSLDIRLSR
jgi:hypothetical protein